MLSLSRVLSRARARPLPGTPLRSAGARCYHSYPDPNEKPILTTTLADHAKKYDKSVGFSLDSKFKMDSPFPGTPSFTGVDPSAPPPTLHTRLENGLIVASQDMPGMMTSMALIVRAGSAYEVQEGEGANTGATAFLELNAFRSTHRRTGQEVCVYVCMCVCVYVCMCVSGGVNAFRSTHRRTGQEVRTLYHTLPHSTFYLLPSIHP
jgi:hypothetical protein